MIVGKLDMKLDKIASKNGYLDRLDLLRDYGVIPSVKTPNHKKIDLLKLLLNKTK